ncbi:hypothetical protein [Mariniflexile sp. HMF6888]|uniref:hypothetical protein n=1 Tax=Mariniflexile sp. HMF6888 TaxID=3373086 RepID=UPI003799070C
MTKVILIVLHILLTILVIAYIDNGIRTHDMDFYFGKDDGYIYRFKSIVILTIVFYVLMTIGKKRTVIDFLKQGGLGFMTAIIVSVVSYLALLNLNYNGLTFHIVTIIICYSIYFGLKKIKTGANTRL